MGEQSKIKAHAKEFPNDIYIGNGEWIKYIDITSRHENAVSIDHILKPLMKILDSLEVRCVAGCCGFSAYDFSVDAVKDAINGLDNDEIRKRIEKCIMDLDLLQCDVIVSERMNNLSEKIVMNELLSHILNAIKLNNH